MKMMSFIFRKKKFCFWGLYVCKSLFKEVELYDKKTLQLIEKIEKYDAEIFVLSHHEALLTKE